MTKINLPDKHYGPLCLKILCEFANYHKISVDSLDLPCKNDNSVQILSKIMDLMVKTLDEKTKDQLIKEVEEHKKNYQDFFSVIPS